MNNRENIIQCAVELFYRKGYDGVGVQEIVDAAGITKPTLYHYFGSKYGLLVQVVEEKYGIFRENVTEAAKAPGELAGILQNVARAYINGFRREEHFYLWFISMMYAGKESASYEAVDRAVRDQFQLVTGIFLRYSHLLGNMRGRQEQYAIGFIGLINQYIYYRYLNSTPNPVIINDKEIYEIVHQFLHGIYV